MKVFYREAGPANAPVVLLLHGFPTSSHMFRNLIPELADRYHVIAPDYPGYGQSDMPDRATFSYTFDRFGELVDGLLDALSVKRYAMYVMDYGAPVGWRLALKHPPLYVLMAIPARSRESWRAISACSAALLSAATRFLFRTTRKITAIMTSKISRPPPVSPPPDWASAGEINKKLNKKLKMTIMGRPPRLCSVPQTAACHGVATRRSSNTLNSSLRSVVNVVAEKLPYIADKVSPNASKEAAEL